MSRNLGQGERAGTGRAVALGHVTCGFQDTHRGHGPARRESERSPPLVSWGKGLNEKPQDGEGSLLTREPVVREGSSRSHLPLGISALSTESKLTRLLDTWTALSLIFVLFVVVVFQLTAVCYLFHHLAKPKYLLKPRSISLLKIKIKQIVSFYITNGSGMLQVGVLARIINHW